MKDRVKKLLAAVAFVGSLSGVAVVAEAPHGAEQVVQARDTGWGGTR